MSGLFRNLLTLLLALFSRARPGFDVPVVAHFRAMPWDCGTRVLKSDKYLQFAEAAQLDYLVKTKLLGTLVRGGLGFVNASQLVKFSRPIAMFKRVRVETEVIFADDKCAYFSHALFLGDQRHGEVLVKMKFKKGSVTVRPRQIIDRAFATKPPHLDAWDRALEAM